MDALEWDEEEIITRDRRWPPGTVRVTGAPVVQIIGAAPPEEIVVLDDAELELVDDPSAPAIDVAVLDDEAASHIVAIAVRAPGDPPLPTAAEMLAPAPVTTPPAPPPARDEETSMLPDEWALATQRALPKVTPPEPSRPVDMLRDSGAFRAARRRDHEALFPPDDDSLSPAAMSPVARRGGRLSSTRLLGAAAVAACLAALISWRLSPRDDAPVAPASEAAETADAAEPAPPPRPSQRLSLDTTLSGVRVQVDGVPRGTLPLTIEDISIGEHMLRFEADRRLPMETKVIVAPGETLRLHDVKLELASGALTIDVATPGAHVMLGRKGQPWTRKGVFGPFPKTIEVDPSVRWEVVAGRYGYRPMIAPVELDERGEAQLTVTLEALPFGWDGDIYE